MRIEQLWKLIDVLPDPLPKKKHHIQHNNFSEEEGDNENNARQANYLLVQLGEHWIIVGKTGSGKTHFTVRGALEYLRKQFPDVPRYIIDSTNDPKMPQLVRDPLWITGNMPPDIIRDTRKTLVWTPDNSKIPKSYCDFFERLNDDRRPSIIVVDEIASMTKQAEDGLETLFRQMRKHGGTVLAETQQIASVDTVYFQQATHFVQFRMNPSDYDDRRSRNYLDITKDEQHVPMSHYGFFHRNTSNNTAMREYSDFREMFQGV
jgi:Cdc6-like AAA superfamily ATPase